jgi:hypothetical protein
MSSPFAHFARVAENTNTTNMTFTTKNDSLTVQELIHILQTMLKKDPSIKDTTVFIAESGYLSSAILVSLENDKVIIADSHM